MGIVASLGSRLLPFERPWVVGPPGRPALGHRVNIIVATPMRSGTHVLIDLILNNLPAYRVSPLYINLDKAFTYRSTQDQTFELLSPWSGHVIKSHAPIDVSRQLLDDPHFKQLLTNAVVVGVHRPFSEVAGSLSRWGRTDEDLAAHATAYCDFWSFWKDRLDLEVEFADLFDHGKASGVIERLAFLTKTTPEETQKFPHSSKKRKRIYANKGLTRALGRHAPRIDTTIYTLKR